MQLTGNTVLITGASSGIGLALARLFLAQGNVVLACGRDGSALDRAKAAVPALITRRCDVSIPVERAELIAWVESDYPKLNILINNAGVQSRHDFTDVVSTSDIEAEIAINFTAPTLMVAGLQRALRRNAGAAIINVTSGLAFSPMAIFPVYCATKAAMHTFTLCLRHQLKPAIRVIEIAPPIVLTSLGGMSRDPTVYDQPVLSADEFAAQVMTQLAADKDEVLVGLAIGARAKGEALFALMND